MTEPMSFQEADNELRQMLKWSRAFVRVEEVLRAAGDAVAAQKNADVKVDEVRAKLRGLEANFEAARVKATEEQTAAAVELEHLRETHFKVEERFKHDADETRKARERAASEVSTASELRAKELEAKCKRLAEDVKELEAHAVKAQGEWDRMQRRMGIS